MKKLQFLLLFTVCSFASIMAQAPANRTVYDCNSNSKNIYATLATGKSIIIAHNGVDCSICVNAAPGWQTWAAANTNNVEVWGAITYTYFARNFPPANMCTITQTWKTTHNWTNIFTFPDSNRLWYQGSSPRYFVYSAIDSSIVYQGSNSTSAKNAALAQSTVGINKNVLEDAKIFASNGKVIIRNLPIGISSVKLFNIQGQLLLSQSLNSTSSTLDVSSFNKGIYIVQFSGLKGTESKRLLF